MTAKWQKLWVGQHGRSMIGVTSAVGLTVAALVGSGVGTAGVASAEVSPSVAPLRTAAAGAGVTGGYIVVLKDSGAMKASGLRDAPAGSVVEDAVARGQKLGVKVGHTYSHVLRGYSARLDADQLSAVRADPNVAYVQQDQTYHATVEAKGKTQTGAPWGLDRIDQHGNKLQGRYYYSNTGAGVTAYVVDTGIRPTHSDFTGRVLAGADAVGDGRGAVDCDGHGTHVSGTVGGTKFGVAKGVNIVPVRVLDCEGGGSSDGVAAGLDWIAANRTGPAVANMSLGNDGGADPVVEKAVNALITSGVTTVVAAGNGDETGKGVSACSVSPARVRAAVVVGATGKNDKRAGWSNYGSCVDIYAPGVGIQSDWYTSNTAKKTLDGTSMATPHVTGTVALYLQNHPSATPAGVQKALTAASTKKIVKNVSTKWPHNLLFSVQPATKPTATTTAGQIPSGQALLKGKKICSPNGLYCLSQRSKDGKLALLKTGNRQLFNSNKAAAWTIMQTNGNLVSYDTYGHGVWSSATSGGASTLKVLDNGTARITLNATGKVTWTSNKAQKKAPVQATANSAVLDPSQGLYRNGVKLQSANGKYQFMLKENGDLVLWKVKSGQLWHSGVKDADWLTLTTNGNLVLRRSDGKNQWSSKTDKNGATKLTVQDNGDVTLRRTSNNKIIWHTKTAGK